MIYTSCNSHTLHDVPWADIALHREQMTDKQPLKPEQQLYGWRQLSLAAQHWPSSIPINQNPRRDHGHVVWSNGLKRHLLLKVTDNKDHDDKDYDDSEDGKGHLQGMKY